MPDSQSKFVAAVATSKDTNLGVATFDRHDIDQVHFGATAAIRYIR